MDDMTNKSTKLMPRSNINVGSVKDGCYYAAPFMAIELIFIIVI
jgi:hypothetical protein